LLTGPEIVAFQTEVSCWGVVSVPLQVEIALLPVLVMFRYAVYPPDHALTVHPAEMDGAVVAARSWTAPRERRAIARMGNKDARRG